MQLLRIPGFLHDLGNVGHEANGAGFSILRIHSQKQVPKFSVENSVMKFECGIYEILRRCLCDLGRGLGNMLRPASEQVLRRQLTRRSIRRFFELLTAQGPRIRQ